MSQLRTAPPSALRPSRAGAAARWMLSFVGFPIEEQFSIFGAAGAVTVTMLTAVLLHTRFLTEMNA